MRRLICPTVLGMVLGLLGSQVSATTIGYWRFEGDGSAWLNDSSGSGHTLTARGTTPAAQYPLPATGPGSAFPNPIPQTGQANLDGTTLSGSNWLTAPDNPAFTQTTFTIEAFVNPNTLNLAYTPIIAGHFQSNPTGTDQRSWFLAVNRNDGTSDGRLQVALSNNGQTGTGNTQVVLSSAALAMVAGKDYYAAATVSVGATPQDRSITFYLQNLTDGGSLLTDTQTHSITTLFDSSAAFGIGGQGMTTGSGASWFPGVIDEVRFSSGVLAPDELLVVVPEPAAGLLAAAGLGLAACGRWSAGRRLRPRG